MLFGVLPDSNILKLRDLIKLMTNWVELGLFSVFDCLHPDLVASVFEVQTVGCEFLAEHVGARFNEKRVEVDELQTFLLGKFCQASVDFRHLVGFAVEILVAVEALVDRQ